MAETTIIQGTDPAQSTKRTAPSLTRRPRPTGHVHGRLRLDAAGLKYPDLFSSVVAFAGGYRWPEELTSTASSYAECLIPIKRFFARSIRDVGAPQRRKIRGKLTIQIYVGDRDPGLAGNRRMHALLTNCESRTATGVRGHRPQSELLAENVKTENFEIAESHLKNTVTEHVIPTSGTEQRALDYVAVFP